MGRRPSNKPTSFDIAYLAGVSQPTVSRALRGSKAVSLATRQKVEAIARQLNYTVDKNASSLRSQRANTLALLFFEDPTPDESNINPFFLSMLGPITRHCAARGLDLLISFQKLDDDWHKKYQESHRADGLILLGYGDYTLYEARLRQLVRSGTHFVRWGSVDQGTIGATIGSDNFGAGRLVGEHLLARGRRAIAFLGQADPHYPEFQQRHAGFLRALETAGIAADPALFVDVISSEELGYRAARTLIERGRPFDAIFAASDLIAIGALRALNEAGLSVPGDVALVGFDDLPAASLTSPPLTTVMQDMRHAGEALVETVLAQIDGRALPPSVMPTRLIVRGSTGG
ncbi:LacI family DNA-binding transcriptional regulator [Novosphingobium huizhouense]|uniref:LacI family DNA-binding transcriptional regulator n=1 Tax=Novosphingobium huizhouense TaxID=2866625 RepID=UPI001CD89F0D|nr:LacI family DNA-binding transcriptional regulator [Novosphingobium huizhouense]